jgi:transcriptional regulator with XRE-family HTH domain
MKNLEIRLLVSEKGLKYTDIARQMGINKQYLSRLMGRDLTINNKVRILGAIANLTENIDEEKTDNRADIETIIAFLEQEYMSYIDNCGINDEINVMPCKKALNAAKRIQKHLLEVEKNETISQNNNPHEP